MASRSGGYLLTNRRLELEQKSQDLASKVLMEALFLVLHCAAAFTVLGILFSSSPGQEPQPDCPLPVPWALKQGSLKRSYLAEILLLSLGAVILTQLVLLVQWSIREASFVGTERGILSYLFTLSAEKFSLVSLSGLPAPAVWEFFSVTTVLCRAFSGKIFWKR